MFYLIFFLLHTKIAPTNFGLATFYDPPTFISRSVSVEQYYGDLGGGGCGGFFLEKSRRLIWDEEFLEASVIFTYISQLDPLLYICGLGVSVFFLRSVRRGRSYVI